MWIARMKSKRFLEISMTYGDPFLALNSFFAYFASAFIY